ncbi:MAG: hypothetical protein IJV27_09435 [Prevotella sp.]|nr:hypothetical protein [Prevotella sp.]
MSHDVFQPVPQRSVGAQDAEKMQNRNYRQRTPQIAIDTYMAALGFGRQELVDRYANDTYTVWGLIPRNVLRDRDDDIYVVDAEIKRIW